MNRATVEQRPAIAAALKLLDEGDQWINIGESRCKIAKIEEGDDLFGGKFLYAFKGSYETDNLGRRKGTGPLHHTRYVRERWLRARVEEEHSR